MNTSRIGSWSGQRGPSQGRLLGGRRTTGSAERGAGRSGARKRGLPRFARLAFLVVFVYLIAGFVVQEIEVVSLARQVRDLEEQAAGLAGENARLAQEIEYAQTDSYIEQVAREELGLIWPNEIPYAPGGRSAAGEAAGGAESGSGQGQSGTGQ